MAASPEILTARLRLRPFAEHHLTEDYVGWLKNRVLMRYSEQRHKEHTLETCRHYWKSFEGTPNYFWAIETRDSDSNHIGNLNAYVDVHNRVADLGILIAPEGQGSGYGVEAWVGAVAFLLFQESIRKVTAGTLTANAPMIQLARNAGMVDDGIRRRQCMCDGSEVDVVHFALFRDVAEATARDCDWARWLGRQSALEPPPEQTTVSSATGRRVDGQA